MKHQSVALSIMVLAIALSSGFSGYYIGSSSIFNSEVKVNNFAISDNKDDSIASALHNDQVIISVHDKDGNLISEQETSNIITSAGAIWFCIQQNRCESQITNPNMVSLNNPIWWIQLVSGTPNSARPTAADCTSPSGGGDLTGVTSGSGSTTRCITDFGPGAQYEAGGSIITISDTSGSGQLRGPSSGNAYDTTNNFVRTVAATVCSIVDDGTAPSSGTCQFSETTPILTNMSGNTITVNGLALASGDTSNAVAGELIIAESAISSITLAPGDTIGITWTIVV